MKDKTLATVYFMECVNPKYNICQDIVEAQIDFPFEDESTRIYCRSMDALVAVESKVYSTFYKNYFSTFISKEDFKAQTHITSRDLTWDEFQKIKNELIGKEGVETI